MKNKKSLLSVLLAAVLLCACVAGMLVFGVSAEATNEVYVVDGVGGAQDAEGNPTFASIKAALQEAAKEENAPAWEAGSTLTIKLTKDFTLKGQSNDVLFEVSTIFTADNRKLPITIISDKSDGSNVNLIFNSDTDNECYACSNDYTFENLNMQFRTPTTSGRFHRLIAGSGNVVLKNVVLTDTAGGACKAAFYGDVAGESAVYKGWTKANVDAEKARYESDYIRGSITFFNTDCNPTADNNWTQQRLVARSSATAWTVEGTGISITNEMTEARLVVDGNSTVGRLTGAALSNDAINWPGKTVIEVKGGTVSGITGDSGSPAYNFKGTVKNIKLDIIVSGGTINKPNASKPYPYSVTATVRDPYGDKTDVNIYINGGTLKGGVYAIGGNDNAEEKPLSLAGNVNIYLNGGTVEGSVYGANAESANHSLLPTGKIYIEYNGTSVTGGIYGWCESNSTVEGEVCINFLKNRTSNSMRVQALANETATLKAGGKAGIKISGNVSDTGYVYSLISGTVESGAEVYFDLESGTLSALPHVAWFDAEAKWVANAGAVLATRFNGGIYQRENCNVFNANYTVVPNLSAEAILRMEWNGTVPYDPSTSNNAEKANYRYFSPIASATIPCNLEAIFTNINTALMNKTPTSGGYDVDRLDRWINSSVINGDVTLIIDTTEDGWKMNADGTRADDDSNVNKPGVAVAFASFQDWSSSTKIGGHAKTFVNGGEDKTVSFNDFQYEPGTQVTVVMENCVATGQVGLSRANGQGSQAQDGTYAIGDASVSFKNVTASELYAFNTGYSSSGTDGHGTYGTVVNVYGSASVSLENCTVNGKTVLYTPNCKGSVADITVKGSAIGGELYLYKGKLTLSGSQVHIPATGDKYSAGAIRLADGTELVIEEDCGRFRHGIGKVKNEGYNTVGGNITIHGGSEYGYTSSGAGGIVGNEITITGGNFERMIQGNIINISGGRYGVSSCAVDIQGGEVHISGSPRFSWASTVTGDVVSLDGGTIYMDGSGQGSITATTATAVTTIQKYEGRSLSNGHVILTIPAEYADLINVVDSNVTGYLAKEIADGTLKVTERVLTSFSAVIVLEDRVSIKYIFDRAQVENAFLYCKKEANFVFNTPGGVVEGDPSDLVLNEKEGRYEYILPAVSVGDFDFEYSFESSLNSTLKFTIISLAESGAEKYAESKPAAAALFSALVSYGNSVNGGDVAFDLEALQAYAEEKITPDEERFGFSRDVNTIHFTGMTLLMGDTIGIRLKADSTAGAEVYYNDTQLTVNKDYRITGTTIDLYINAKNFETILNIVVKDAEGGVCLNLRESVAHLAYAMVLNDYMGTDNTAAGTVDNVKLQATAMLVLAVSNYLAV